MKMELNMNRIIYITSSLVVFGTSLFLTGCSDPFHRNKFPSDVTSAPLATPTPLPAPKRRLCTTEDVQEGFRITKLYSESYRDLTGAELATYLVDPNDRFGGAAFNPVKGIRLSALGIQLDKSCLQTVNCTPTAENKEDMTEIFRTCTFINSGLIRNVIGLSPTGKALVLMSKHDSPDQDYGHGGYITDLVPFKDLCKEKTPDQFPPPRDPTKVPSSRFELALWYGIPLFFTQLGNPEKTSENDQLQKDLGVLCEAFENQDKEEYCGPHDPDIVQKCQMLKDHQRP